MIESNIFNASKSISEYKATPLFFGAEPGLFDTVNKQYPKIWSLYKEMKSLDWDENEFDYTQCNTDFKNCDPSVSALMIRTLAWQWEADSVASRSIIACFMPFITSSELFAAWCRVSDNEVVHSSTYSEIVRMSFDDPERVLGEVLEIQESLQRLGVVGKVFTQLRKAGARYQLRELEYSQQLYNDVYLGVATLLMLERIQFMSSFAITFTICSSGLFQPIGKAVQKICQDELEVHCELDKEILRIEHQTKAGQTAKAETAGTLRGIFEEIVDSELAWTDNLFSEGRTLVGATRDMIKQWVLFNAKDVAHFLKIDSKYSFPRHNPMPGLENWINMNKTQAAPQEQDLAQYKINAVIPDDDGVIFDSDF